MAKSKRSRSRKSYKKQYTIGAPEKWLINPPEDCFETRHLIKKTDFVSADFIPALEKLGFDTNLSTTRYNEVAVQLSPKGIFPYWSQKNTVKNKYSIYLKIQDKIKSHLLARFSKPHVRKGRLSDIVDQTIDPDNLLYALSNITGQRGLSHRKGSYTIQFDFDMSGDYKTFKAVHKTIFKNKKPMHVGISCQGRLHLVYATNKIPSAELLSAMDSNFMAFVDVRTETRTQRLPYNLKYTDGFLNADNDFEAFNDIKDFVQYIKDFDLTDENNVLNITSFEKEFLPDVVEEVKEPVVLEPKEDIIEEPVIIDNRTSFEKAEAKILQLEEDSIIPYPTPVITVTTNSSKKETGNVNYSIGGGECHQKVFKEGLGFKAYRLAGGDFIKFVEILKSWNMGSKALSGLDEPKFFENAFAWVGSHYCCNSNSSSNGSGGDKVLKDNRKYIPEKLNTLINLHVDYIVDDSGLIINSKEKWREELNLFYKLVIGNNLFQFKSEFKRQFFGYSKKLRTSLEQFLFSFPSTKLLPQISREWGFTINLRRAKDIITDDLFTPYVNSTGSTYIVNYCSKRYTFTGIEVNYNNENYLNTFIDSIKINIERLIGLISEAKRLKNPKQIIILTLKLVMYQHILDFITDIINTKDVTAVNNGLSPPFLQKKLQNSKELGIITPDSS